MVKLCADGTYGSRSRPVSHFAEFSDLAHLLFPIPTLLFMMRRSFTACRSFPAFISGCRRPPGPALGSVDNLNLVVKAFGVRWRDTALDMWMFPLSQKSKHPNRCPATAL